MRLPTILFFLFFTLLVSCTKVFAQTNYNSIATAYVTTTISQHVVFDSAMQQGGTYTMSVLAHNGGGRAGQSDTANVKIQFFTTTGQEVHTVASAYSNNLPNPQNVCGNPCIDTSVPWSTLTISLNLTAAQAANIAYARVSMYGIDGSYWAGDYGPWYRAPTFQHNGGSNLLYNPEFGPYNGVQAQGWTTSPGLGACQGAWGGSNPCIANSSGTPGVSTTGLVANENGGGPSPTGGTTSGTAGGYNNTMSVTNAGTGATSGAAPAPTVTGTSVTYTTRTVVNGNTTTIYRTPVTTTTYSDGTSTTSNGAETLYQTKVSSTVTTNTIAGTTLTTINTPINTVTTSGVAGTTIESNGAATTSSQTIQRGLNFEVFRYDSKTYNCGWLGCVWDFGRRIPDTNRSSYGNPVNSGVTSNGMYLQTNARLPNNDGSWFDYNDNTVIRYYGTITAPITQNHPAGSVYRLYFYNNTDDGFRMWINNQQIIFQNSTNTWQVIGGYTSNGWMDVVAGQTYNIEAWYWNVLGGVGHQFYWDYGDGIKTVTNNAFTTGTISNYTIDTSGVSYSNSSVVNITGSTVVLGPSVEGGTITMTNGTGQEVIGSGSGSVGVTTQQQNRIDNWNNGSGQNSNNYLYIDQVSGNANTVNVTQTTTSTGKNRIEATISGSGSNNIDLTQTGTNYLKLDVNGAFNSITSQQSNNTNSNNFKETTITGSNNIINTNQKDNANKIMFNTVTGSNNSITAVQEGTGNHYLENVLTGNGHSVIVNQNGSTANNARIDLSNSGGPASVDLQQSGGKSFSIIQSCSNPAGCTTVVRQ